MEFCRHCFLRKIATSTPDRRCRECRRQSFEELSYELLCAFNGFFEIYTLVVNDKDVIGARFAADNLNDVLKRVQMKHAIGIAVTPQLSESAF